MGKINESKRALLALTLGGLLLIGWGCGAKTTTTADVDAGASGGATGADVDAGVDVGVDVDLSTPKVITVKAKQFSFSPAEIRVKQGQKVKLMVESEDVTHGFALPAFNINLSAEVGKTATAEFTADKKGTFPFLCSVFCGSGHGGMKGSLIVE